VFVIHAILIQMLLASTSLSFYLHDAKDTNNIQKRFEKRCFIAHITNDLLRSWLFRKAESGGTRPANADWLTDNINEINNSKIIWSVPAVSPLFVRSTRTTNVGSSRSTAHHGLVARREAAQLFTDTKKFVCRLPSLAKFAECEPNSSVYVLTWNEFLFSATFLRSS